MAPVLEKSLRRLKNLPPGEALILYYAASILLGALALCLPVAAHGEPLSFLDALFTATSAQCVTGLVVVDTGTKLTLFGQVVVLALIQIGGLGSPPSRSTSSSTCGWGSAPGGGGSSRRPCCTPPSTPSRISFAPSS